MFQQSLFGAGRPQLDRHFSTEQIFASEIGSDGSSWVAFVPRFVTGAQQVFERIRRHTKWAANHRVMYDKIVAVPRLTASLPADGVGHPILADCAAATSRRYGAQLDRWSAAYYRDGNDSVAWHSDRTKWPSRSVVAILSLGAPRRLLLRHTSSGSKVAFDLHGGDLLVMGGACQLTHEHAVLKVRDAGPRISVMFRHTEPITCDTSLATVATASGASV